MLSLLSRFKSLTNGLLTVVFDYMSNVGVVGDPDLSHKGSTRAYTCILAANMKAMQMK